MLYYVILFVYLGQHIYCKKGCGLLHSLSFGDHGQVQGGARYNFYNPMTSV